MGTPSGSWARKSLGSPTAGRTRKSWQPRTGTHCSVAFKAANKGTPLKDALLAARKDPILFQRFLITPTGATAALKAVQAAMSSIKSNKGNHPTPDPQRCQPP